MSRPPRRPSVIRLTVSLQWVLDFYRGLASDGLPGRIDPLDTEDRPPLQETYSSSDHCFKSDTVKTLRSRCTSRLRNADGPDCPGTEGDTVRDHYGGHCVRSRDSTGVTVSDLETPVGPDNNRESRRIHSGLRRSIDRVLSSESTHRPPRQTTHVGTSYI